MSELVGEEVFSYQLARSGHATGATPAPARALKARSFQNSCDVFQKLL